MPSRHRSTRRARPSLAFWLLSTLMVVLCLAGGASRADVMGQVVVRAFAALLLAVALLTAKRPEEPLPRAVIFVLATALLIPLLQLIPLPPALWEALPGRALFQAAVPGPQPWRPIAIRPDATSNAAAALLIPITVLALACVLKRIEWERVLLVLVAIAGLSAIVGLLQVSGSSVSSPLVNATAGAVSGLFANRNHFALFLAIGSLIAPVWAAQNADQASWRIPFAAAAMLFFFMLILASGSRAGILNGLLGSAIGLAIIRRELQRALSWLPRWGGIAMAASVAIVVAVLVMLSVASDRAQSVNRVVAMTSSEDMRARAFPTVVEMIRTYLPVGSGFGTFDTVFRIHEPFSLLKPTYFNHAHNDFLEIVLDGGVAAALLLAAALVWWGWASIQVWRAAPSSIANPGRLGSGILLLVLVASAFDYPARTPLMMAIIVLAATWLSRSASATSGPPTPVPAA